MVINVVNFPYCFVQNYHHKNANNIRQVRFEFLSSKCIAILTCLQNWKINYWTVIHNCHSHIKLDIFSLFHEYVYTTKRSEGKVTHNELIDLSKINCRCRLNEHSLSHFFYDHWHTNERHKLSLIWSSSVSTLRQHFKLRGNKRNHYQTYVQNKYIQMYLA